jgi:hypothetical protein
VSECGLLSSDCGGFAVDRKVRGSDIGDISTRHCVSAQYDSLRGSAVALKVTVYTEFIRPLKRSADCTHTDAHQVRK